MEKAELFESLTNIFIDIFDNEDITINSETTAEQIEEWDSLTHIQLVVAIEKHFKIRFTSQEIQSWRNVGEMADSILSKGV